MDFKCQKCSSDQVQPIQMVLATGIQDGKAHSVNFYSGGGVGFGSTDLNLSTRLASRYDPGSKPIEFGAALMLLFSIIAGVIGSIILIFATFGKDVPPFALLLGAFFILVAYCLFRIKKAIENDHKKSLKIWEEKSKYANDAWLCLRCGHNWIP